MAFCAGGCGIALKITGVVMAGLSVMAMVQLVVSFALVGMCLGFQTTVEKIPLWRPFLRQG